MSARLAADPGCPLNRLRISLLEHPVQPALHGSHDVSFKFQVGEHPFAFVFRKGWPPAEWAFAGGREGGPQPPCAIPRDRNRVPRFRNSRSVRIYARRICPVSAAVRTPSNRPTAPEKTAVWPAAQATPSNGW